MATKGNSNNQNFQDQKAFLTPEKATRSNAIAEENTIQFLELSWSASAMVGVNK